MKLMHQILVAGMLLATVGTGIGQPNITTQPQPQTNLIGTTATFSVVATGAEPLTNQWQGDFGTGWNDLFRETNSTLVLVNVQTEADYRVVVGDTNGTTISDVAHLYVIAKPSITSHPTNSSVCLCATAINRVGVSGTSPFSYQWRFNGAPLPGRTLNSITLLNAQVADAGNYDVVVTNIAGSITSRVAVLNVDPTFTKITQGPVVEDREASGCGAWCDYDNDGWMDLFVANASYSTPAPRNSLYHNQGDGTFVRVTNALTAVAMDTWGALWADYDNDGAPDLLTIPYYGSLSLLYHNDGHGVFTRILSVPFTGSSQAGGAWADMDCDGLLDLVICNHGNQADLAFRNLGGGNFQKLTTNEVGALLVDLANNTSPTFADFDNDGDPDLYVTASGGQPFLYRNRGGGMYEKVQLGSLPGSSVTTGGVWADFNNDGLFDLITVGNNTPCKLHTNVEGREFRDVTAAAGLVTPAGSVWGPAWGDFDNDGDLDLFIPYYSSTNMLFVNNGDGTFRSRDIGSPLREGSNDSCAAWVDYDNDGFLDLFVACGEGNPAPNLLYRNNLPATGNTNHWLKIKLEGKASNAMGIGTKIRVRAVIRNQETWQLRQIASNGSFASGPELLAHFGLGDATNADVVRIEWPSGIVQTLSNVALDQLLTITEHQTGVTNAPSLTASKPVNGKVLLAATGQTNLRYVFEASTNLVQWTKISVRTNLTGTAEFTDNAPNNIPRRFYRVLVP